MVFGYVTHIRFTICILYSEYNFSFIIYKPCLQMDTVVTLYENILIN